MLPPTDFLLFLELPNLQAGREILLSFSNPKLNISNVQRTQQASKLDFSTDTKYHARLAISSSPFNYLSDFIIPSRPSAPIIPMPAASKIVD